MPADIRNFFGGGRQLNSSRKASGPAKKQEV